MEAPPRERVGGAVGLALEKVIFSRVSGFASLHLSQEQEGFMGRHVYNFRSLAKSTQYSISSIPTDGNKAR